MEMSLPMAYVTRYAALKTVNGSADSIMIATAPMYTLNSSANASRRPMYRMRAMMSEVTTTLNANVDAVYAVTKIVAIPAK